MQEELIKLGVDIDDAGNIIVIAESVKTEDVEILPSSELAESTGEIQNQEEKEAGLFGTPRAELALRVRVRGKINIRIKFLDPAVLGTAQLAQNRGSVWIRGEAGNRGGSIQIGDTIRFSVEKLNAVEIEGAEVLPVELLHELNSSKEN